MRIKLVAAGAFVGLSLAWAYPSEAAAEAQEDSQGYCYFVDMEKISEETVQDTAASLRSQQWFAIVGDGEILYHPNCLSQDVSEAELEQYALLEQVRALRAEVDALRLEVQQLLSIIEEVVDTFRLG
jgi:hypothetical protein